jgi:replicative DNA helicase
MKVHTKRNGTDANDVKLPPYSLEAEQSVLGSLMFDHTAWDKIVDKVTENDFFHHHHRLIFNALHILSKKDSPFDVLTVAEALKNVGELDNIGGELYLFELVQNTPTAVNVVAYANIVRERSILRQLIGVANEIADSAFFPEGRASADILDSAEQKIFKIADQHVRGSGPVSITEYLAKAMERIDTLYHSNKLVTGIPTGFTDFDGVTSGLQQGDLIIIAGRPSMGKTTFAMNIAENAAIKDKRSVLVFSMEMSGEQLALRMISSLGRIDQHRIRNGNLKEEDWPRITSAVSVLSDISMFIDDTPALSPSEVRARARRLVREKKNVGLIVIDYLQLMQLPGYKEHRTNEISEISRSLKALAKELHIPVIALSQLNRSLEQRPRHERRPIMSDLRESGAIEQDADLVIFIYRDEVYNENSPDKGKAEIIIAKQRNGPIGKVSLTFLGQFTVFENYTSAKYPEVP